MVPIIPLTEFSGHMFNTSMWTCQRHLNNSVGKQAMALEAANSFHVRQILLSHPSCSKEEQLQTYYKEQVVQQHGFSSALACTHNSIIANNLTENYRLRN